MVGKHCMGSGGSTVPIEGLVDRPCSCDICKRHKEIIRICTFLSESDSLLLKQIIDDLEHSEFDRDYYRAILRNEWPGKKVIILEETK